MADSKEITWSYHSKDFCKNAFPSKKQKQLYPFVVLQILFISWLHLGWLLKENKSYAVKTSIHFSMCLSISRSEINSAGQCQSTLVGRQTSQKLSFSNLAEVREIFFFFTGSHLNVAIRNKRLRKTDSTWDEIWKTMYMFLKEFLSTCAICCLSLKWL